MIDYEESGPSSTILTCTIRRIISGRSAVLCEAGKNLRARTECMSRRWPPIHSFCPAKVWCTRTANTLPLGREWLISKSPSAA